MASIIEQLGQAISKSIDVEGLATKLWDDKIWPWAEAKLSESIDKYLPVVIEKIFAALPSLAAASGKTVAEEIFKQLPHLPDIVLPELGHMTEQVAKTILDSDPDIPGLSNVIDVSEILRKLLEGH